MRGPRINERIRVSPIRLIDENEDMIAVCECLVNNHFRRVPILSGRRLAGIISRRDLIKYIMEPIGR